MLFDLIIFLPVAAGLIWFIVHALAASRERTFPVIALLQAATGVYLYAAGSIDKTFLSDYRVQMVAGLLTLLAAPCILPLAWSYLRRLRGAGRIRPVQAAWAVFPAVLFAGALLLVLLAGEDVIVKFLRQYHTRGIAGTPLHPKSANWFYYYITVHAFRIVILGELLSYGAATVRMSIREQIRLRHLGRFLAGKRIRVLELQVFTASACVVLLSVRMLIPHEIFIARGWVPVVYAAALTVLLSLFYYFALFSESDGISLRGMSNVLRFNYNPASKARIVEEMLGDLLPEADEATLDRLRKQIGADSGAEADGPRPTAASGIYSTEASSRDNGGFLARFEMLMFREQLYLMPGITLNDIADRMRSNKTYVSRLVNCVYGMPFPDLANTLRIHYAQQYLLEHRNARQSEVAEKCGFTSASTFNNIFKKITGTTPKRWLSDQDPAGRKQPEDPHQAENGNNERQESTNL